MGSDSCTYYCWVSLALVTTIMIISVLKNISYYLKEKKLKEYFPGKIYEDYPKHSPSDGEFYTEECPVYDNLNHCHPEMLNESCYEQMNAQPHPSASDVQQVVEHQMCYASLDHSVKRKQKRNKKKYPTLGMDEDHLPGSNPISSDTCIYLNSEQLSAENTLTDNTIHEDPFDVFGFIHTTNDDRFQ
ncbi:T-cell receptor-associated transmembrane adapter 1-like [Sceloporus undulatus]|uniref:T-cell receptor-associated transmembrane adapter 1-like n=1 Tax=Sceloporus undulatus TaxID=8520 RepID=UPI001C4D8CC0|nr:T-cell receptor-associated transmembrane adapter 1-like [Sceloporus undulatus]